MNVSHFQNAIPHERLIPVKTKAPGQIFKRKNPSKNKDVDIYDYKYTRNVKLEVPPGIIFAETEESAMQKLKSFF